MGHEETLRQLKDLRDYHKHVDWTEPKHTQALAAAIEFIEERLRWEKNAEKGIYHIMHEIEGLRCPEALNIHRRPESEDT